MIKVIIHHDLLFYCNHPINTRFWPSARMRKGRSLLSRTRWRRRAWRLLLERNAGGRFFCKQSKSQVSFYSFFCWSSDWQLWIVFKLSKCDFVPQRLWSSPSLCFLPWWPTLASPFSSTTMMADFVVHDVLNLTFNVLNVLDVKCYHIWNLMFNVFDVVNIQYYWRE